MVSENKKNNVLIIYSSAQGTTTRIAEAITEGMNSAGASAFAVRIDILSMMPERVLTADIIGIGFPVYFHREPRYIDELISGLPPLDGKNAFVFCTCGMNSPGETFERVIDLLSQQGANVIGAEYFPSAMSYLPYRRRGFGNNENLPDEEVLASARRFGESMAGRQAAVSSPPVSFTDRIKAWLLSHRIIRKLFLPGIYMNPELCTGYGQCMTRCQFNGLAREDEENEEEIPYITDNCIQCLQCIDWCPRSAIEINSRGKELFSAFLYHLKIH